MDAPSDPKTYVTEVTPGGPRRVRPTLGTITEPARQVPVTHDVDVLIVGGGPAGTTAAIASARLGARTLLVERYNHLGGLSTGGLVIWIDRMTDWHGKLVIQGIGRELLDRLPGTPCSDPAQDPGAVTTPGPWLPGSRASRRTTTRSPGHR